MPKRARRLLSLITPIFLVAACSGDTTSSASPQRPPTAVAVKIITQQDVQRRIQALGTLLARDSIDITTNVSEKITALHFRDGEVVNKGQSLATLAQQEERALLAAAEANLAEQERELQRLKGLIERKVAAQTEYDQRQTAKLQAQARIKEVEAMIAERNLRAPFAGHVGLRRVSPGALITPGQVITTLDDIQVMRMDFQIPALFLTAVTQGQTVEAYSEALQQSFSGKITAVDSRIDPIARNINVRAELPNPELQLKPGMLMQLSLITEQRPALMVPEEALQSIQDQHYVWVMTNEQTARQQQIELGLRKPGLVEASSGLSEGDKVIYEGYDMLREGAPVAPQEES
jgi:membrane fusion protein (multidrug efflux system)